MAVFIYYEAACLTTGHTPPLHLCVIQSSELSRDEQPAGRMEHSLLWACVHVRGTECVCVHSVNGYFLSLSHFDCVMAVMFSKEEELSVSALSCSQAN